MTKRNLLFTVMALAALVLGIGCNMAPADLSTDASASMDISRSTVAPTYAQEVTSGPLNDSRWTASNATNLDLLYLGKKIVAYQIKWFNGSWSKWYVPGVNDEYKKSGENVRRAWACFNDHTFRYIAIPASYAGSLRDYSSFDRSYVPSRISDSRLNYYTLGKSYNTSWVNTLNINIDRSIDKKMIVAYKIKWFNGTKSGWIVPGYKDIYQKPGENSRRWWACFNDHEHDYLAFTIGC